jgi:hypothetical protein
MSEEAGDGWGTPEWVKFVVSQIEKNDKSGIVFSCTREEPHSELRTPNWVEFLLDCLQLPEYKRSKA